MSNSQRTSLSLSRAQVDPGAVPPGRVPVGALVRDRGVARARHADRHRGTRPPSAAHRHVLDPRVPRVHAGHRGRRLGHLAPLAQERRCAATESTSSSVSTRRR